MERTDTETMFNLTKEAFIKYLNEISDGQDTPFCYKGNCPLKQFYIDTDGGYDIHVSSRCIHLMSQLNPTDDIFELPEWAKYFVDRVDQKNKCNMWRYVTPRQCLEFMKDV